MYVIQRSACMRAQHTSHVVCTRCVCVCVCMYVCMYVCVCSIVKYRPAGRFGKIL